MTACATFSGILFSRKPCGQPGVLTCGRCKNPVCKQHVRPQKSGPFLCPSCDAYASDDDWGYSNNDNRWHYRDRSRSDVDPRPVAAGAAAGAAASDLADEDKAGLSTNASGAWHGPDGAESGDGASWQGDGTDGTDGSASATDDGDFDAS